MLLLNFLFAKKNLKLTYEWINLFVVYLARWAVLINLNYPSLRNTVYNKYEMKTAVRKILFCVMSEFTTQLKMKETQNLYF